MSAPTTTSAPETVARDDESPRRRFLLAMGAPAVLVLVALLQLYLAHTQDLSPWKGGGFGMFASVDGTSHRVVRASLVGDTTAPIDVTALMANSFPDEQLVDRARTMPDEAAMDRLASRVADLPWRLTADGVAVPAGSDDTDDIIPAEEFPGVQVEVWRVQYDAAGDVATPERLAVQGAER
jgi:hypothetical protein